MTPALIFRFSRSGTRQNFSQIVFKLLAILFHFPDPRQFRQT